MSINSFLSTHPLQSKEWAEFRKKIGTRVIRSDNFQLTVHKIPYSPWTIGYLAKGPMPNRKMIKELKRIGKEEKCIFIQLEPNVPIFTSEEPPLGGVTSEERSRASSPARQARESEWTPRRWNFEDFGLRPSFHPLFTNYTFILDLTKSEEELLKAMHPKTRYNIKVAQKYGVKVIEDNSDMAFEAYLKLTRETTKRQGFYAHDEKYHRTMWKTLKSPSPSPLSSRERDGVRGTLAAHLLLADYKLPTHGSKPTTLVAWILFVYKDILYYPYGASSNLHRETMASNLMMWEAIRFGKQLGLKKFDMWGALGPNPDKNDPWYGFHRFKQGYGGELVELAGSFDLVVSPLLYQFYKILDKIRWVLLRLKST